MEIFVSFDGDSIGQQVGRASLADDVTEVRRLSKLITDGNQLVTKWALGTGGQVVSDGGDEVVVIVDASRIGEVPLLRQQYGELVGATISVGVGMRLSEAAKALLVAKLEGKDRIVTYGPHVENTIQNLQMQDDEQQKLQHEYLARAEATPEAIQGTVDDPHMHMLLESMEGAGEPGAKEEKQPGDYLKDFHGAADKQKADADAHAEEAANDGLKMKIAAILQQLKGDPQTLAALQQQNPELAQAIAAMANTMVAMGRQLWAEKSDPTEGSSAEVVEQPGVAKSEMPPLKAFMLPKDHKVGMKVPEGGSSCANCKFLKSDGKSCGNPVWVKWHDGDAVIPAPADEYCCDGWAREGELEKGGPEGEIVPEKEAENIEKAATEAGKTGRHNVVLPPGSQKDTGADGSREGGKRKVLHADDKSSWQSMRSGVVPSPTGRPTSAKHPGGLPKDKPALSSEHYSDGDLPQQ